MNHLHLFQSFSNSWIFCDAQTGRKSLVFSQIEEFWIWVAQSNVCKEWYLSTTGAISAQFAWQAGQRLSIQCLFKSQPVRTSWEAAGEGKSSVSTLIWGSISQLPENAGLPGCIECVLMHPPRVPPPPFLPSLRQTRPQISACLGRRAVLLSDSVSSPRLCSWVMLKVKGVRTQTENCTVTFISLSMLRAFLRSSLETNFSRDCLISVKFS